MSSFTQFLLVCKWAATWISSTTYVFISIIFFFLRFLPISANLIDICFESVQIKQCAWSVHSDVFECESCLALLWFKLSSKPCHSKALSTIMQINHSANIYLFKFINRNNRKRCGICSKLTIKTPERLQWRRCDVFIVNVENISHPFLVFLYLTLNK